uniref:Uncharacterized protein n=1 Tax=Ananas comosus var. bracteatus TaxID=296719 RepID=A0A6V7PA68_ANACO|nr:unnamed protein product [Ananas comosus var. bracteatus]
MIEEPPPTWTATSNIVGSMIGNRKRLLSKQLSMKETTREAKWEKRRRQIMQRRHMMVSTEEEEEEEEEDEAEEEGNMEVEQERNDRRSQCRKSRLSGRVRSLTDEDLDELRGSIELGFGFNEEDGGQYLCDTLPALDLYFAVNRQFSDPKIRYSPSPISTPTATSSASTLCGTSSPQSPTEEQLQQQQQSLQADSWKIFSPGDNPQHVKTRLRHWAQAVACSVRQCC